MALSRGRRRLTCHHEAGHVLVRWYFGFYTDAVEVLTIDQVRAGVTIEDRRGRQNACEGMVMGHDIHNIDGPEVSFANEQIRALYVSQGIIRAEIALIELRAGAVAEAQYRKRSWLYCYLDGGRIDMQQANEIKDIWLKDHPGASNMVSKRTVALVRSKPGAEAIRLMADRLWADGRLEGDQISDLCRSAYGGREASYGTWDNQWPPTLAQLRAGYIPERRTKAA